MVEEAEDIEVDEDDKEDVERGGRDPRRFSGLVGMVAPFIFLPCIFIAILLTPDFSWTEDSLSSLAGRYGDSPSWSATGAPALFFNFGLLLGGLMMVIFANGLRLSREMMGGFGSVGSFMLMATGVTMLLIGVFPLTFGPIHTLVSYLTFFLAPVSTLMFGLHLVRRSRPRLGRLCFALAIFGGLPMLIPWPFYGIAIPETLMVVPMVIFMEILGYRLFYGLDEVGLLKVKDGLIDDEHEEE
jgi:hypothetical membrane protein